MSPQLGLKLRSLAAICRQATIVLGEKPTANGAGLMPCVQEEWVPAGSTPQMFSFALISPTFGTAIALTAMHTEDLASQQRTYCCSASCTILVGVGFVLL